MKARRIISAAAAITLAMSLASCGNNTKKEAVSDNAVKADKYSAREVSGETAAVEEFNGDAYAGEEECTEADDDGAVMLASPDAAAAGDAEIAEKRVDVEIAEDRTDGRSTEDVVPEPVDELPGEKNGIELPDAGQLTAGEWRDNDNWGFFANLVNSETISFPSFNIDPRNRVAITLKGDDGEPIANAKVNLIGTEGGSIWSAVTDRSGRAYLFAYSNAAGSVEIEYAGEKQSFDVDVKALDGSDEQGKGEISDNSQELVFKGHKGDKGSSDAQIMFIVDTTSSMSDEMLFLQSEFSSLIKEVGTDGVEYAVNFYRDEGDEYVTKCMDFTSDAELLRSTIVGEYAAGGGDIPEAVGQALEDSIVKGNWKEDCVKVAFLIFDAPPHGEHAELVESAVRAAAEKGIKLIPVVSSNSERDTELFGRAVSIVTGGSYVFLTDDSGIGDSHLEPIIGDYEVEKLYDIIVRLINEYRA